MHTAIWATCRRPLCNYLLRLGWSHGDDEIISPRAGDRMVRPRCGRALSGALRLRQADQSQRRLHRAAPTRPSPRPGDASNCEAGSASASRPLRRDRHCARPGQLARARQDADRTGRKRLVLRRWTAPFLLKPEADGLADADRRSRTCVRLRAVLAQVSPLGPPRRSRRQSRRYVETAERPAKLRDIAQPLRAALTGATVSPPIFEVMETLGRDETLARLDFVHGNEGHDEPATCAAGLMPERPAMPQPLDDRRERY